MKARGHCSNGGRAALVATGTVGFLLIGRPAAGHTALVRTVPAEGTTVGALPAAVELTFNEAVPERYQVVVVTAPDGVGVSAGKPQVRGTTIRQPIRRLRVAGRYVIAYRVASADGHLLSNRVSFSYFPARTETTSPTSRGTVPPTPPPAPPATAEPAGSAQPAAEAGWDSSVAVSVVAAGLVALAAGGLFWRRSRRLP